MLKLETQPHSFMFQKDPWCIHKQQPEESGPNLDAFALAFGNRFSPSRELPIPTAAVTASAERMNPLRSDEEGPDSGQTDDLGAWYESISILLGTLEQSFAFAFMKRARRR
jgi:hypothetical protein